MSPPLLPQDITMTSETEALKRSALHDADDISGRIHAGGYRANLSDVECLRNHVRKLVAALSRAPEAGREGAAERLAIVAGKPARLIRWGEGDRLDLQSVLAALSPPSTGGEGEAVWASRPDELSAWSFTLNKAFADDRRRCGFEVHPLYLHPSPEMGEWRPEVRAFADLMEAQLRANDHKPGWKDDTDLDLFERLGQESAELLAALHRNAKRLMWGDSWVMEDTVPRVGAEAADVANFAMMIADVCGALKLKENGLSREELGGSARASRGAAGPSDCAETDVPLSDGGEG